MLKNLPKLILMAVIITGVSIAGTFFYIKKANFLQENLLSSQVAAQKAIDFINQNISEREVTASLVSILEENGVYKILFEIKGQEYESYITRDGKYLFPEGYDLTIVLDTQEDIEKKEKPDVKLFVMSYCPFGLQAQKMFLPVYDLLKDKADIEVYFVNYIMHEKQEIDENLRQYCIQKEEKEKYYSYLSCFVESDDFEKCLLEANIDMEGLGSCVVDTDHDYSIYSQYEDKDTWLNGMFPKFDVHDELNKKYGVRGSPTIVINDQVVTISDRSPEKFKESVCQAFSSLPEECSQVLSDTAFSSGFGLETGGSSGGGCVQ